MDNPLIIAEAGVNHNGYIQMAFDLIRKAKTVGVDCVKFQAFTADNLSSKSAPKVEYQEDGRKETQHDLLKRYELSQNAFKLIISECQDCGIEFLVTPFDSDWVQFFYGLGINKFKISSGSVNTHGLLETIGQTGSAVIMSTGMSNIKEVENAVSVLYANGCQELSLLHCVSLYPTRPVQVNLFAMQVLMDKFNVLVGFSDHTEDIYMGGLAVAAGATILEKHFTLDKQADGPDHKMSLLPHQLSEYIRYAREVALICGDKIKEPIEEEIDIKKNVQTSLVASVFIKQGSRLERYMVVEKRPSSGISCTEIDRVIGSIAIRDIDKDEVLTWEIISEQKKI